MDNSPIVEKLFRDRDKLIDKIRALEDTLEKRRRAVYVLRELNFQLRKKLRTLQKEKAGE